jgi:hypothetical protein
MGGPAWLSDTFAAVMLAVSIYCAGRLAAAGAWRRETDLDADGLHLVMGVAMAGMLAHALSVLPPGAWEAVFAVAAAWFAWQAARVSRGHGPGSWRCAFPLPHLAESLAMVYAFAAVRPAARGTGAGMPGMGAAVGATHFPVLAVVFALFMLGYVAWLGDRLTSISPGAAVTAAPGGAAQFAAAPAGQELAYAAGTRPAPAAEGTARTLARPGPVRKARGCWPVLAPRAAACSKIAMGITMGYMLIVML